MYVKNNICILVIALIVGVSLTAPAQADDNLANSKRISAAKGKLVIYSATDSKAAEPLLKDFSSLYPDIKVEYNDMNSTEVYNRFISEIAAGGTTADVLWSSSMDLQLKLVSEGYAAVYKSPESTAIPTWANYQDSAYGTTYEPVAIVYNKRLVDVDEVPASHADLVKLLKSNAKKYRHKVTTYDIEKSGVGFALMIQDAQHNPYFWYLVSTLGYAAMRVQSSTGTMLERISSGEHLIGYNVLGAYAIRRAKEDPSIGVAFTTDYNLVMSRVVFINKKAKNGHAARLWIDYLLSKRGQTIIANEAQLYAIRSDVVGNGTLSMLTEQLGTALKPIPLTTAMLTYLNQTKRLAFLKQWKAALNKK